jgi:hypothetical protein
MRRTLRRLVQRGAVLGSSGGVGGGGPATAARREGFGSFHSEDVETLIRRPASEYVRPQVYDDLCRHVEARGAASAVDAFDFGLPAKAALFALDDDWTFVNHGAFGGALLPLLEEANVWRYMCESQPLRFFDRQLLPMVAHSVREAAAFFDCPATELVPLPNVTAGLNSVANSLNLRPGDVVMCLSVTYGSTKKILQDACVRAGATLTIVPLPLPIASGEAAVAAVRAALAAANGRVRAVVLDEITSNTALCLPVAALACACKEAGALVVVDAAHAMFAKDVALYRANLPVDADATAGSGGGRCVAMADVADVWLTNAHKWMCAPKGAAFMWVSPRTAGRLRPAIVSHGYTPGSGDGAHAVAPGKLLSSFAWDGCRDYAALLTVPSAIALWGRLAAKADGGVGGLGVLRRHNRRLLDDATAMLAEEWGVPATDFAAPPHLRAGSPMSLVPLPRHVAGPSGAAAVTDAEAFRLQEWLHHDHAVEVPVKCLEGRLYVRISAHVYNTLDDYQRLAHAVKSLRR